MTGRTNKWQIRGPDCDQHKLNNNTLPSLYHGVNIESKLYSSHATIRLEAPWCHFNAISRHTRHNRPHHHYHHHQQQLIKAFKETHCNVLEHKFQTRRQIFAQRNLFWIVLQITLLYMWNENALTSLTSGPSILGSKYSCLEYDQGMVVL